MQKKRVSIIGATGSVGKSAFNVITGNKEIFEVEALVAKSNYRELAKQAIALKAEKVFIEDIQYYQSLIKELQHTNIKVFASKEEIINFIAKENSSETILICSSGYESIPYFYTALKTGKTIAMANKEAIVCGGNFATDFINKSKSLVIPVDSEHSALYQSFLAGNKEDIASIVITASGGAFIDYSLEELKNVSLEQALNHPTWSMGKKITIDSATLMNKALEVIEASVLFSINAEKIEVVIHRQSILHGGVNYKDGSFIGHFSYPNMEVPVAYGLYYPHRINTSVKTLNLAELSQLKFEKLNEERFIAIKLAKESLKQGKNYPCALNVANEVAVESYFQDKISFHKIVDVVEYTLGKIPVLNINSVDDITNSVEIAKVIATEYVNRLRSE
ncbi:MAG: 1-deoxy-D-xylulose-5-phosphate reductoisomerase [Alphaproteobacteria bacterium]|jgi:1-deoxy-D-xylulose-5-phosphate reductoisomerase|nr:1-deoxy-D-xylulose-5-phosphate reductoisomerase [Alphaproteobacteria bacterium]